MVCQLSHTCLAPSPIFSNTGMSPKKILAHFILSWHLLLGESGLTLQATPGALFKKEHRTAKQEH